MEAYSLYIEWMPWIDNERLLAFWVLYLRFSYILHNLKSLFSSLFIRALLVKYISLRYENIHYYSHKIKNDHNKYKKVQQRNFHILYYALVLLYWAKSWRILSHKIHTCFAVFGICQPNYCIIFSHNSKTQTSP